MVVEAGAVAEWCAAMMPGPPGAATGTGDPSLKSQPVSGDDIKHHLERRTLRTIDDDVERLLTPAEVAQLFRVNPKTVARWATTGQLGSIRTPGGHRRFRESEVSALFAAAQRGRSDRA